MLQNVKYVTMKKETYELETELFITGSSISYSLNCLIV